MRHCLKLLSAALFLLLAACSAGREGTGMRAAINPVSIQAIEIEVDPAAYAGPPQQDSKPQLDQMREYRAALSYALKNRVIGKPGGAIPAKLVIRLHQVELSSGIGRVMAGSGSRAVGTAVIVDLKTPSRVIAVSPKLVASEAPVSGSGNIGDLVAVAAKVPDAGAEARAERLARNFADAVGKWLEPRR